MAGEFIGEPWFSFNGYQSSHYGDEAALRWMVEGPPSEAWKSGVPYPIVNLEPCYEAHLDMSDPADPNRARFDAHAVRRASYWGLLSSPMAGVTYGCHGVWGWELERQLPMNHEKTGVAGPWHEAMNMPGSLDMRHLKETLAGIPWWTLRPAQDMLAVQPGRASVRRFIAAARDADGGLALLYLPEGG